MNPNILWDFQICSRENVQNKALLFSRVKMEPSIQIYRKNGEHVEEHVDKYTADTRKDQIPDTIQKLLFWSAS